MQLIFKNQIIDIPLIMQNKNQKNNIRKKVKVVLHNINLDQNFLEVLFIRNNFKKEDKLVIENQMEKG
jgi:hypothetical protein